MPTLPSDCPSCRARLAVTHLACESCGTHLEGAFELPALLHLSQDDVAFVVRFVKTSGSLKEMSRLYGQSYPTIRNRLDGIIERLNRVEGAAVSDERRHEILDAIAKGTMSVDVAERMLRALS